MEKNMEKTLKQLIAEMDRIEALEPNEDNQMQEGFADALKGVMDKIANKLGYQPKDPELADLFKKYAELQQEIESVMKQIDAHPELADLPRVQGSEPAPQDAPDQDDPALEPGPPGTGLPGNPGAPDPDPGNPNPGRGEWAGPQN